MTMAWLESQLRSTDIYADQLYADQLAEMLAKRGEDIPLPQPPSANAIGGIAVEAAGNEPAYIHINELIDKLPNPDNKPRTYEEQLRRKASVFVKAWKNAAYKNYLSEDRAADLLVGLGIADDTQIAKDLLARTMPINKVPESSGNNELRTRAGYSYIRQARDKDTEGYIIS